MAEARTQPRCTNGAFQPGQGAKRQGAEAARQPVSAAMFSRRNGSRRSAPWRGSGGQNAHDMETLRRCLSAVVVQRTQPQSREGQTLQPFASPLVVMRCSIPGLVPPQRLDIGPLLAPFSTRKPKCKRSVGGATPGPPLP
jgi:hypothetical protein